jgi:predicted DNA-binding transcriptional regulator AlpA
MQLTRLIGAKELRALGVPFSRAYLLKLEKRRQFPQRVRLGPNSVAWRLDEIQAWIEMRSAARGPQRELIPMAPRGRPKKTQIDDPASSLAPGEALALAAGDASSGK